ncbi:hypothetical protein JRC49_10960 [Clostridiales bacterium FE2011]|nr:hypothetical protein JRC49_10960 [Clostridiales bacterium FE2011]
MKKLGVMLALMLCLTVIVPMALAVSSKCPVHEDGYHHYAPSQDSVPYYAENYGNETFHRQHYYHIERCACGDWNVCAEPYRDWSKDEYHVHNTEVRRDYVGASRIDSQYHYRMYNVLKRCQCGHEGWDNYLVDRSVKIGHSFTNVVSSTTKNGKRIVVKKCACGERKTFTYTVPPTQ